MVSLSENVRLQLFAFQPVMQLQFVPLLILFLIFYTQDILEMDREEFYQLPAWKQKVEKQRVGLF